jgi:hypothetical protein
VIEYGVWLKRRRRQICFRPHGDRRSDFIRGVQAAGRHPTWCDRGPVMPASVKHRQRMASAPRMA